MESRLYGGFFIFRLWSRDEDPYPALAGSGFDKIVGNNFERDRAQRGEPEGQATWR
jgi:hypothetical protein